jgi:zeaxanthin glucosyltransferase
LANANLRCFDNDETAALQVTHATAHDVRMSTIAFWMLWEEGHLFPTFQLASALRARGHRVVYAGIPDHESLLVENGFEHVPILEELYPRGALARARRLSLTEQTALVCEEIALLHGQFVDGVIDELLRRLSPDLLLCDILLNGVAMAALHAKIPFVRLCTSLPQTPAPGVPPLTSRLPFDDSPAGIAAAERVWAARDGRYGPDIDNALARLNQATRRRYGVPAELFDARAVFADHMVGFPQLVLCSPALDFPRPPEAWLHHGESLWLERREPAFAWEALDPDRPLVYCSMGSQPHSFAGPRRFLAELLVAAARAPAWQFVIVTGGGLSAADFAAIPDNAVLVPFAPQLGLLRRSRLAITHGGLGTLKECMVLGVPVLVFPAVADQPGNAARIEYHGLGRTGDMGTATADQILAMARAVLEDAEIPRRIAAVQRSFVALEEAQPGLALAEQILAAG